MGATNAARSLKALAAAALATCAVALCAALPGQAWADGWDGTSVDIDWYNDADTEFTIDTAEELAGFAQLANAGDNFAGKKITLGADIDLNGKTWTPIVTFAGVLDGNEKTISNFHIDATGGNVGFFGTIAASSSLEDIKVYDLTLSNATATVGDHRFGFLANSIKGVVKNVTIKNVSAETTGSNAWVAGFCAFMDWPWICDSSVENFTVNARNGAEFVAGFACIYAKNSNHVFDNLDVKNFSVTVNDSDGSCGVAGFVGQTQRGWEQPKMTNCDVSGLDVTAAGTVDVGGFIAWPGAHTLAENCTVQGKIDVTGVTSSDCFAGGFFGNLGWNADLGKMGHVVTNCKADVDIATKVAAAGGFVGSATNSNDASMYATFNSCSASGDITCAEGGTADIGGFAGDADRGAYNDCTASGNVANGGTGSAGQFIGAFYDVTPKYDSRYPAGTRDYPVNEASVTGCSYSGPAGLLPFVGGEEEGSDLTVVMYVAQVGEDKFETLQDAIDAAGDGDTVTLLSKVELTEGVTISKELTLDLNGNFIDAKVDSSYGAVYVKSSGDLTIADSSGGAGMIYNELGHAVGNYGTVTVKGGEIGTGKRGGGCGGLYNFYYCAEGSDAPTYGKASIEEGRVDVVLNCGELKVSGGEIFTLDNSGSLAITGGYIGDLVDRDGSDAAKVPGAGKISASGGAFEEEIDSKHIAEGYELKDTGEGVWIVQLAGQGDSDGGEGDQPAGPTDGDDEGEDDSKSESKDTLAKTGDAAGMAIAGAGVMLIAAGAVALIARRRAA